jgi:cysteine desulfurase family protein (TIGR01976 family)
MTQFDIDYVRKQFPAFAHPETGSWAFFENAGGSYAAAPVVDKLNHFMTATKMQPYGASGPSREAGEAMDLSQSRLAAAINASVDEVMFGPSTSMNTYVISQAMRIDLNPGDEVIVTNQEHEANIGAWSRLPDGDTGIVVREWTVDPHSGLLDMAQFTNLLNERTRLVCVTHCSNIVGVVNDVPEIVRQAHQVGALVAADGVSFAPHLAIDVKALDVDFYFFSLYKTFGPHQGILYARKSVLDKIANQGHFFNAGYPGMRLTPAGPMHGEIACSSGVVDYMEQAHAHHFPDNDNQNVHERISEFMNLGHSHEIEQSNRVLSLLRDKQVRIIGNETAEFQKRAPTIAFTTPKWRPIDLASKLSESKVGVGADNFYAYRLMQGLGIPPDDGVVRISLVHYTSAEDVDRLLNGLDEHL